MPQDWAELRVGVGQLILGINGLVLREDPALFLEEEPSGNGLYVAATPEELGEAPPNILSAPSRHHPG